MKPGRLVLPALMFGIAVSIKPAIAVPFDVIVPEEIRINTTAVVGVCFHHWGWVVATKETISQMDLDGARVSIESDPMTISISQDGFSNVFLIAPLDSSEVAGVRLDPENASAYDSLLTMGETIKDPSISLFTTEIIFPSGHVDTVTATGTLIIAGHELTYTTQIVFGSFGPVPTVTKGQRISATAIPVMVSPATWGELKTRFLNQRHPARPSRKTP